VRGFFSNLTNSAQVEQGSGSDSRAWARYRNIPQTIGRAISSEKATLLELQTVYGTEDLYDILEVVAVDSYNNWLANQKEEE
jgi:hypothetical protein